MGDTITIRGGRFELQECINCGVAYAMPAVLLDHARAHGGYHYCPNGHSQGWSKDDSEEARTRRERDRLKQDAARLEEENKRAWAAATEQRQRAVKAEKAAVRLKKRASAGTCPCCSRTFSNMATHMKRQHPEFVQEGGAKVVQLKAIGV